MTPKASLALFVACCHFFAGSAPAFAQLRAGAAPAAVPVRAVGALAAPMTSPAMNPALPGGISASGLTVTPTLSNPSAPSAVVNAVTPAQAAVAVPAAASVLAAPAAANLARPAATIPSALPAKAAASAPAKGETLLQSVGKFANAVSKPAKGDDVAGRSRKTFDGGNGAGGGDAVVPGGDAPQGPDAGLRSELSFR
ncbi:MAG: hypothetical protein FD126_2294, partial [Elusimicrobia bacterium]